MGAGVLRLPDHMVSSPDPQSGGGHAGGSRAFGGLTQLPGGESSSPSAALLPPPVETGLTLGGMGHRGGQCHPCPTLTCGRQVPCFNQPPLQLPDPRPPHVCRERNTALVRHQPWGLWPCIFSSALTPVWAQRKCQPRGLGNETH